MVDSGPFRVAEFKAGQRIVLERFDKFFLPGKPYLEKIVVTISPDMARLMLGLERGDIQMMPFITIPTDLRRVAADKNLLLTSKCNEGIGPLNWLAFNAAKKPLSDLNVRKAIALSIDSFAVPADGPIVATSPFAVTDVIKDPLDLKRRPPICSTQPATRPVPGASA